jgi:uncharacterized protein YbbK (DUF523 family)
MKLVSACLLGINTKYDGTNNKNEEIIKLAKEEILIPVCPEQLGGLPTPREFAEIKNGRVITKSGKDVTENFKKGAEEVLKIAKLFGIKEAILKSRSPSCGENGVLASLLKRNGIKVIFV